MTPSSERRLLVVFAIAAVTILGAVGARWLYRYQLSCIWAARDYTHFALQGSVRKVSCTLPIGGTERIVLALDSAAAATAAHEAATNARYRRIETILPDSARSSAPLQALVGQHGWYYSTIGQNSNGGYTFIVFDEAARTICIEHAPF